MKALCKFTSDRCGDGISQNAKVELVFYATLRKTAPSYTATECNGVALFRRWRQDSNDNDEDDADNNGDICHNAGCSGSSSSEVDIGQLTLDDGQLCPAELEQALQGDSLLLMACSAGYYQLAQVLPSCTGITSLYRYYHLVRVLPACTGITSLHRYYQLAQVLPACTVGIISLYRYYQLVQVLPVPACTVGIISLYR